MSHYFLVKWVEPEDINSRYNICIRRSIVNPRVPFDQIRAGDRLRIRKRGSKIVRLATMYMRSGEIHPLIAIRERIKKLEANQGYETNNAESSSERFKRITRLMGKLMQQLITSDDKPVNAVELGSDANNNKISTTERRNQFAEMRKNATLTVQNREANPIEWVPIGSGSTVVHRDKYKKVNWRSYTFATRTLLCAVFPRSILATHSLTGKKSPAFQNKPAKTCLNTIKTSDIIIEIMNRFKIKRNLVRNIITIKCADECKMQRTRDQKMQRTRDNKKAKR